MVLSFLSQGVESEPKEPREFPRAPLQQHKEEFIFKGREASQDKRLEMEMQTGEPHRARLCVFPTSSEKRGPL